MSSGPPIFISTVSKELRSARQLVANTLTFLGYAPEWQDIFSTEEGDLREMLRRRIDACKAVVQVVGHCYGVEPPVADEQFGRVSYTQYEALYARLQKKQIWYLILSDDFPTDPHEPESQELRDLQTAYRARLTAESYLYHPLGTRDALEASVLKLRDELSRLRRATKQWAGAVIFLLMLGVSFAFGHCRQQRRTDENVAEILKLVKGTSQFAEVQNKVRQENPAESDPSEIRRHTYEALAKDLGIKASELEEKLPKFAEQLRNNPNASSFERANAAYVAENYDEAERLALGAADEATKAGKTSDAIKAFELAGFAAEERIENALALQHFRAAAQLTDRTREPLEWAGQQWNIAHVLTEQGHYAEAAAIYREALFEFQLVRGEEDEEVLSLRNDLANVLGYQGKYAEKEAQHREILKIREKVLGPEHPQTLDSRNNLAGALADMGKYAEAEALSRQILELRENVLGPEHPDTLQSRQNLGSALYSQGKYAEAEKQFQGVLKLWEKLLGREHPTTLLCRNNLAAALGGLGKYAEAEAHHREVLKIQEKVLGSEHPSTLSSRNNLANRLMDQGKYAEAEAQYRQVLKIREKVLGPEHPKTLLSRNSVATTLQVLGKYAEAEAQYREVRNIQEEVLGPEHPDTLVSRSNLASTLSNQGKYAEAYAEHREVLKIRETALGPEHPNTLVSRSNLATTLRGQGKYAEAEEQLRDVIRQREKVLGAEHPDTLDSCFSLASCLKSEMKIEEAKVFAWRAAQGATKILGPDHPDTLKWQKLWQELQDLK